MSTTVTTTATTTPARCAIDDCSGGSEGNCRHAASGICAGYAVPQTRECPADFFECGPSAPPTSAPTTVGPTASPTQAPTPVPWTEETFEMYFATNAASNPTVGCGFLSDADKVRTFDDSINASLVAACDRANTPCRMISMASVCGSIISTVVVEWAGTGSFRDVIVTPAVTAREITGIANDRIAIATEVFPRLERMSVLVQSDRPAVLTRAQATEVAALLLADIAADIGLDPARFGNGDLTPQLGDSTNHLLQFLVTMETGADQQAFPALSISIRNLEALGGVSADYQIADLGDISFQSVVGSSTTTVATNTGAGTAADDDGVSDATLYILVIVVIIAVCAGLVLLFFWRRRSQEHQKLLFNVISGAGAGAGGGFSEQQFLSADGDLDLERWWSMTDGKGSAAPPVSGATAAGTAAGRVHYYPGAGAGPDARSTGLSPEDHGGYFQSDKLGLSEFDDRGMSNGHHYYPENSANSDAWVSDGGGAQPPPPFASKAASSFITMPRSPLPVSSAGAKWKLWSPMGSAKTEASPTKATPAPGLDGQALQDFQANNTMTVDAELNQRNSHDSHRSRPELDASVATEDAPANDNDIELTKTGLIGRRSSQFEEEPVRPNELKDNKIFRGRSRQDNGDPQTHDWAGNPLPADLLDPLRRRRSVTPTRAGGGSSSDLRQPPMSARQAPMSTNPGLHGSPSPLLDALRSFDHAVAGGPAGDPSRDSPDEPDEFAAAIAALETVPIPMLFAESDEDEDEE